MSSLGDPVGGGSLCTEAARVALAAVAASVRWEGATRMALPNPLAALHLWHTFRSKKFVRNPQLQAQSGPGWSARFRVFGDPGGPRRLACPALGGRSTAARAMAAEKEQEGKERNRVSGCAPPA